MKDIIYSGVGVGDEVYRGGSRVLILIYSEIVLTLRLKVMIIIQFARTDLINKLH